MTRLGALGRRVNAKANTTSYTRLGSDCAGSTSSVTRMSYFNLPSLTSSEYPNSLGITAFNLEARANFSSFGSLFYSRVYPHATQYLSPVSNASSDPSIVQKITNVGQDDDWRYGKVALAINTNTLAPENVQLRYRLTALDGASVYVDHYLRTSPVKTSINPSQEWDFSSSNSAVTNLFSSTTPAYDTRLSIDRYSRVSYVGTSVLNSNGTYVCRHNTNTLGGYPRTIRLGWAASALKSYMFPLCHNGYYSGSYRGLAFGVINNKFVVHVNGIANMVDTGVSVSSGTLYDCRLSINSTGTTATFNVNGTDVWSATGTYDDAYYTMSGESMIGVNDVYGNGNVTSIYLSVLGTYAS